MFRMTVVSASQKKANKPAVSSAGTWKLACKLKPTEHPLSFQWSCVLPFNLLWAVLSKCSYYLGLFCNYMFGSCTIHTLVLEIDVYGLLQKGKRLF